MKKSFLYFLFTFICANVSFAQKGLEWMPLWERSILDSTMNMHYTYNENYIPDSTYLKCNIHRGMPDGTHISSNDGHLIAILEVRPPLMPEDTLFWGGIDKQHIYLSERLIKFVYGETKVVDGEEFEIKWKNYVSYLSDTEMKRKINADTVIIISLPPMYEDYYMKPRASDNSNTKHYPYCTVLMIQKNGRGYIPMYFFYDEVGKKDLEVHIEAIASSFRYGEESPLLKKIKNEDFTVVAPPQQKKGKIIR